jgi:EmrB/QacA subfamily drug resistance transporter
MSAPLRTSTMAYADHEAKREARNQTFGLVVVNITSLMLVIATNSINVALPDIQKAFNLSAANLSWIVTGYALAFAGFILLSGKVGSIIGAKRALIIGTAVFIIASAVAGIAPDSVILIIARVVQGIGAAIAAPSTLVLLVANTSPGVKRTRALALFVLARGSGGAIGLILGGILSATIGWQWVMYINVPLGIVVILGSIFFVKETARKAARLDFGGAVTSTLIMVALVYGFTEAASLGWGSVPALVSFAIAIVSLVALILIERRHADAVVQLRLFESMRTIVPYVGMLFVSAGMYAFFYFLALFSQDVFHYNPLGTGLALLPFVVTLVIFSQVTPRLIPRFGERLIGVAGLVAMVIGMFWLGLLTTHSTYAAGVFGPALLLGIGVGLSLAPLTALVMHFAPSTHLSEASSMLQAMQQLGGAVGVAILTTFYVQGLEHAGQASGIALAMIGGGVFTVIALVFYAIWAKRITAKPTAKEAEAEEEVLAEL